MKFFTVEISRKDTIKGLFLRTPWFTFAIYPSSQSPEETIADRPLPTPLWKTAEGIANRTDPLLMDGKQRHENTVRMFMERKGYKRKEIDLPLTDDRMKKIGRMTWDAYKAFADKIRKSYPEQYVKQYVNPSPAAAFEAGGVISILKKGDSDENKTI